MTIIIITGYNFGAGYTFGAHCTPSLLSCLCHYWSVNTSPPLSTSMGPAAISELQIS
jgi:hypothetical protein